MGNDCCQLESTDGVDAPVSRNQRKENKRERNVQSAKEISEKRADKQSQDDKVAKADNIYDKSMGKSNLKPEAQKQPKSP